MKPSQPIIINGQRIGKLRASWLLLKEAWRYLQADKELLAIPLISAILGIILLGAIITGFLLSSGLEAIVPKEGQGLTLLQTGFVFGIYIVCAFSAAIGQAGISNTVFTRAHGGNATLGNSLKVAFAHWPSLFLWSVITSTVGVVLNSIAERSKLLGKIVVALLGSAWSVLTYFVVPAMVIDKKSAFASIGTSTSVFKRTWGETLVSNITLGAAFLIIHVAALCLFIGVVVLSIVLDVPIVTLPAFVLYFIWLFLAVLTSSALDGILRTLLYIYASESTYPPNFNSELLSQMLVRATPVPTAVPTVSPSVQ
ncbi:MAG: hypothetical protein RLZZ480_587 [Candidatus Parcubacteria bacterium]|jgi:hypothetical protein